MCRACFVSQDYTPANTDYAPNAEPGEWAMHLELMENINKARDRKKIESDGLSTSYYTIPPHATELRHLISHKGMSKSRGDIFKACYRLGEKAGTDVGYDLNKMKFFISDLIEMHKRGELL